MIRELEHELIGPVECCGRVFELAAVEELLGGLAEFEGLLLQV